MNAKNDERVPRGRLRPAVKLLIGVIVGVSAAWLVVSTAGGLGEAVAAVGRMRPTLVYRAAGTLLPALAGGVAIVALRSRRTIPAVRPADTLA